MEHKINDNGILFAYFLTNYAPLYSAPYETVEDAMEDAPACALVWLNSEGCYQFSECDCRYGFQQIMELARGCYEVSDISLVAWRNRGFWETFGD